MKKINNSTINDIFNEIETELVTIRQTYMLLKRNNVINCSLGNINTYYVQL